MRCQPSWPGSPGGPGRLPSLTNAGGCIHFPHSPPTDCRYMHVYSGMWTTLIVGDRIMIRSKCSPVSSWSGLSRSSFRFGI